MSAVAKQFTTDAPKLQPSRPDRLRAGKQSISRVMFLEDDDHYRDMVTEDLIEEGFEVKSFGSSDELVAALGGGASPDVLILDWGLTGTTGIDVLTQLRASNFDVPAVFLTGRNSPTHERLAFAKGAIEFIDKARGTAILATRLRLVVEAHKRLPQPDAQPAHDKLLQCGRLVLHPRARRAFWDNVDVNLTICEFKIVELLTSNTGCHVPFRQIYDAMHYVGFIAGSGEDGYRANVRSSIRRIRNKFRALSPQFKEINSFNGFGYCWGRRVEGADWSPEGDPVR